MSVRTGKSRQSFTNDDQKSLCDWVNTETLNNGKRPDWKSIQKWFQETHSGKIISQPSISRFLRKHGAIILAKPDKPQEVQKRRKELRLRVLGKALYQWYTLTRDRSSISSQTLKDIALALLMDIAPGQTLPERWLRIWKREHGIEENGTCHSPKNSEVPEGVENMVGFGENIALQANLDSRAKPAGSPGLQRFRDADYTTFTNLDTEDPAGSQLL